jgi:hypothetical protein
MPFQKDFLTFTYLIGRIRESFARSSTFGVIVAENNNVCRFFGQYLRSSSKSSWNPSSSSRSTSSSTSTSRASMLTDCELRRWSKKRPGVQITMSGRFLSMTSWLFRSFLPPQTRVKVTSVNFASFSKTECI